MAQQTINVTNASLTGTITYDDGNSGGGGGGGGGTYNEQKMANCVKQITKGQSEGFPAGLPHSYDWYTGLKVSNPKPPSNFTSMTGWGQVYPEEGQPVTAGSFWVFDEEAYVWLTSGEWVKMQDQQESQYQVYGSFYDATMSGSGSHWDCPVQSDGSQKGNAPPVNKCVHWYHKTRGVYTAGSVKGCFSKFEVKCSSNNMKFIANGGVDWWVDKSAGFSPDWSNNPGAGMGNWIKLNADYYRTSYFTTLTEAELKANPPPPLK